MQYDIDFSECPPEASEDNYNLRAKTHLTNLNFWLQAGKTFSLPCLCFIEELVTNV